MTETTTPETPKESYIPNNYKVCLMVYEGHAPVRVCHWRKKVKVHKTELNDPVTAAMEGISLIMKNWDAHIRRNAEEAKTTTNNPKETTHEQ